MDENKNERAKRGIESIAHLFLSQLNNQPDNGGPDPVRPVRNAPGLHQNKQENIEQKPEAISKSDLYNETDFTSDNNDDLAYSLAGEIVIAYHLRDCYAKVCDYARQQAQHDQKIMLVSIDQYELSVQAVFGSGIIEQAEVIAETEGEICELIPVINQIADGYDTIILNIDPSFAPRIKEIISHADCVTIISDTSADGIVRAYQTLKSVVAHIEEDQDIQLFICDAADNDSADRAFYKFSETARKFINRVIIPAGAILNTPEPITRPLDDDGLSEHEALSLNMVDDGMNDDCRQKPVVISGCAPDKFICQSDTDSVKMSTESAADRIQAHFGNQYKPASSITPPGIKTDAPEENDQNQQGNARPYSDLVIALPGKKTACGPTRLNPIAVNISLASDSEVSSAVSLNFATLTGGDSKLVLEHRPFTEIFDNAQLTTDSKGRLTVVLSCLYNDRNICWQIEELANWLDDNLGVIATRFRHLHLKTGSTIDLAIIAGSNHNDLCDQIILAADEQNLDCRIWQITTFTLDNRNYISLH